MRDNSRASIMFVTLSLGRGGTEKHLVSLTPALAAEGWPVTIFCLGGRGEQADVVEKSGVRVIGPPLEHEGSGKLLHAIGFCGAAIKLGYLLLRQKPTIVHFFLPAPYLIGAPLALLTRRPVRIMSRRSLNDYQDKHPWAAKIERRLHKHMSAILANSAAIKSELVQEEGCDLAKVSLIYNGIEAGAERTETGRKNARRRLGLDDSAFVTAVIANLIPYKGHEDLIRAVSLVKDRMPKPFVVLCAGRDEGIRAGLERLARELGVDSHVKFLGARTDVPDILAAADIGVLASHEEGFSNAVLEGMAAGLPIVVTNVGGNPEAIRDGIEGLVVPSRAPAALGEAILRLATDPDLRSKMAIASRERANANFSSSACLLKYMTLYRNLTT